MISVLKTTRLSTAARVCGVLIAFDFCFLLIISTRVVVAAKLTDLARSDRPRYRFSCPENRLYGNTIPPAQETVGMRAISRQSLRYVTAYLTANL